MSQDPGHLPSKSCFTCQARERTEWCVLNDEELTLIDDAKVFHEYLPGQVIFHEGDPCGGVHCIESGLVGVRKINAGGDEILLRLCHPGDTTGYRSFLAGDDHNNSAEALEPSVVCFIAAPVVQSLLEKNPSLGLRFLKHVSQDLSTTEEKALQTATLPVRARFSHLLLILKDRYGTTTEGGELELTLPLSRQDMAAMIGIRPESMSRTIRSMEQDNIARFDGRQVRVPRVGDLIEELEMVAGL